MNIKTTRMEFENLLSLLEQAARCIDVHAVRNIDLDLVTRLMTAKGVLEKRNGCIEGEVSDSD